MPTTAIPSKLIASVSATIAQALRAHVPAPTLPPVRRSLPRGGAGAESLPATPPPLESTIPAASPVVQMLMPMVRWNWPFVVTGVMSFEQFAFSDTVPASTQSGVPYASTSASFSGSYNTFLNLLAPERFPVRAMLEAALACGARPTSDPASAATPDGWAKSLDSVGNTRWRPAYGVSLTPGAWELQVAGSKDGAVTLDLPIDEEQALVVTDPSGQTHNLSLFGEADHAQVSAAAMTRVALMPGAWFDDTLLRLGKNGAWVAGLTPVQQPYAGMLSGRVSGLIVAHDPVLRIVGPDPSGSASGAALCNATSVTMGGFTFPAPVPVPQSAAGTAPQSAVGTAPQSATRPVYEASALGTWIIGVTIEAFN